MAEVVTLAAVPGKSDAQLAAEHRKAVEEALQPVMQAINAAKGDGFTISFALGADYAGKSLISQLIVAKNF